MGTTTKHAPEEKQNYYIINGFFGGGSILDLGNFNECIKNNHNGVG